MKSVPASPKNVGPKLSAQIQTQIAEADRIEYWIAQSLSQIQNQQTMRPKPGPKPKILPKKPLVCLSANTAKEMDRLLLMHGAAIGKRARGNSRIGRTLMYAELLQHFILLKRNGITLPRNKSLSAKACQYGLPEILRRHECTDLSDKVLLNGIKRKQLADKMDRIFSRIADVIENTPA